MAAEANDYVRKGEGRIAREVLEREARQQTETRRLLEAAGQQAQASERNWKSREDARERERANEMARVLQE
eukprot:7748660-Prorocentrum_lima.AAC.1